MNSSIIELREEDNLNPNQVNGEYEVNLKNKNILIKNGDEINIKSLFLDTTQQNTGKIIIDENNKNVSIVNYLYLTNFRNQLNGGRNLNFKNGSTADQMEEPNGQIYTLCNRHAQPIPAGYVGLLRINSLGCNFQGRLGQRADPFNIRYQYLNEHNKIAYVDVSFPGLSNDPPNQEGTTMFGKWNGDITFFSKGNTEPQLIQDFKEIPDSSPNFPSPSQRSDKQSSGKYNVGPVNYQVQPSTIGDKFTPATFTTEFQLVEGGYTPDLLAKTITDKLSNVIIYPKNTTINQELIKTFQKVRVPAKYNTGTSGDIIVFPSRSNFCSSSKQLCYDDFYNFSTPDNLYLVSSDGNSIMDFEALHTHNNYLIGSSEVSLEYLPIIDKFQFTQLHTSQFSSQNLPVIRYFNTSADRSFMSSSVGGIFFQSLSPPSLWTDILGFDLSSLCVLPEEGVLGDFNTITQAIVPSFKTLETGVNITADFSGVDASLIKEGFQDANTNAGQKGVDIVRDAPVISGDQSDGTAVLNINSIRASIPLDNTAKKEGYYLVQIEGLPRQDLTNLPNDHIQAIVSKYYSAGSFTIMEGGAGSLNYKHIGSPFYLQNLRVKILDPDGSNPEQLGDNNTVFLEIFRETPNMDF